MFPIFDVRCLSLLKLFVFELVSQWLSCGFLKGQHLDTEKKKKKLPVLILTSCTFPFSKSF